MAADMFGDSSLFEEFDKERDTSSSFIFYEKTEDGIEDRSKIHFQVSDSSSDETDSSEDEEHIAKVKEQSVVYTVDKLVRQSGGTNDVSVPNGDTNDVIDSDSEEEQSEFQKPIIDPDRQERATAYKLNYERNKFKRYCNIVDSTRFIHDEQTPAVQILFQNNAFARKYRTQIEQYIESLIDQESRKRPDIQQKLDLKATVPSCTDLNDKIPVERRTDIMWQSHAIIGCSQFYREFLLDTLGWPLVEYNPSLTESWDIPTYEQAFTDILPIDLEELKMKAKKAEKERFKPKCWNCGGDHMMTECKMPRNQQKINESRMAMMADKANAAQQTLNRQSSVRYHKETSVDPRFSNFRPGKISDSLREALGLQDSQLPLYIYKMRVMGYPPGWMMEAQTNDAPVLAMFGKDGNEEDEEETRELAPPELDVNKVIEYPGFTTEVPPDCVDEAEFYGLPPIQPHQLKSTLILQTKMIQEEVGKRKLEAEEETQSKRQRLEPADSEMDIEDSTNDSDDSFRPPLPPETPPSIPPPPDDSPVCSPMPPPRSISRQGSEARSCNSPSLEELEAQYQLLQQSLASAGDDDDEVVMIDSCEDSQSDSQSGSVSANPISISDESFSEDSEKPELTIGKLKRNESTTSIQTFGELGLGSPLNSQPGTPLPNVGASQPSTPLPSDGTRESSPFTDVNLTFKGTVSISREYGTPILNKEGCIDRLPTDTAFQQGIEDHIPFENLPDATGTYSRMRALFDKIRQKMSRSKKKS